MVISANRLHDAPMDGRTAFGHSPAGVGVSLTEVSTAVYYSRPVYLDPLFFGERS